MRTSIHTRRHFLKASAAGALGAVGAGLPARAWADTGVVRFGAAFRPIFERSAACTLTYAEAMPADRYTYKPTPDVRSYAAQMLHIAGATAFFAGHFSSGPSPVDDFERLGTDKTAILAAMGDIFAYAAEALGGMTEAQERESHYLAVPKTNATGRDLALLMRDHMTHHRGQAVIYLRLNGIEPPPYVGL